MLHQLRGQRLSFNPQGFQVFGTLVSVKESVGTVKSNS